MRTPDESEFLFTLARLFADLDCLEPEFKELAATFCLKQIFKWMIERGYLVDNEDMTIEGMTKQ